MKRLLFFSFFLVLTAYSFAADVPPRILFIEGAAFRPEHRAYFLANFRREAIGTGIPVTHDRREAGYIFRFDVEPNIVFFTDGSQRPPPPTESQNVIRISLFRNTDGLEIVSTNFYFSELDEMSEHNQYLFTTVVSHIPPISEEDFAGVRMADTGWKNNRLYLRTSVDYLLTMYALQSTGLYLGYSPYMGDIEDPTYIATPLDNTLIPLPGVTFGVEFHIIEYLAVEANFKVFLGDPSDNWFYNFEAGAEVKVPINLGAYTIQPYAAVSFPLNSSPLYADFPPVAAGFGFQFCTRGFVNGAFFIDAKYLISLQEALMHNRLAPLAPNPPEIHYKRSQITFSAGYKFGFIRR